MAGMTAQVHRRRLAAADRRQQIVDAAAELFVARGFEAVSMADIAQGLMVSRPTVYSYFASPEALLDTLMAQRLSQLWTRLEAQLTTLLSAPTGLGDASEAQPQLFVSLFGFLLGEHHTLALLHCGGGPAFQARRLAFLSELARRLTLLRPGLGRSPHLPLLLTHLLDSVAYSAVGLPPGEALALAQTLATFALGGVAALHEQAGSDEGGGE